MCIVIKALVGEVGFHLGQLSSGGVNALGPKLIANARFLILERELSNY